ncbi:hypothetical protein RRG08_040897, partial [Elysia crispata]
VHLASGLGWTNKSRGSKPRPPVLDYLHVQCLDHYRWSRRSTCVSVSGHGFSELYCVWFTRDTQTPGDLTLHGCTCCDGRVGARGVQQSRHNIFPIYPGRHVMAKNSL